MSELKKWEMNDLYSEWMYKQNENIDKLNEKVSGELLYFDEVQQMGYEGSVNELYFGLSKLSDISFEWNSKKILRTDDFIEYAGYPYQSQLTLLQEILRFDRVVDAGYTLRPEDGEYYHQQIGPAMIRFYKDLAALEGLADFLEGI